MLVFDQFPFSLLLLLIHNNDESTNRLRRLLIGDFLFQNEKHSLSVAFLNMRTTSSLEAFNAVLKRSIVQRFNFFKFISRIKFHECRKSERMYNLANENVIESHYVRRKRNDQDREAKIARVTLMLTKKTITFKQFLQIISTEDESKCFPLRLIRINQKKSYLFEIECRHMYFCFIHN